MIKPTSNAVHVEQKKNETVSALAYAEFSMADPVGELVHRIVPTAMGV
jgi:hypothetical protein